MIKTNFNVLRKKDAQDRDIPQELQLSDGTMLKLPIYEEDVELKKLIAKVEEVGIDNCDDETIDNYFDAISAIMPQIVVNLSDYLRPSSDNGLMVLIRRELFQNFYCVISELGDSNNIAIGWDINDTCVAISEILIQKKDTSIIPINVRTHITAVDITLNKDSIIGNTIVITPTIKNLVLS